MSLRQTKNDKILISIKMYRRFKILALLILIPVCCWSQVVIDSTQEFEIRYFYEEIVSPNDFESFKDYLLTKAETELDSSKIEAHILKLQRIQKERMDKDSSQTCEIVFVGDSIDFILELDGEIFEYEKSNFANVRIQDDYPHYENQCNIKSFNRTDKIINAKYISDSLSFNFKLDLSFSRVKIENHLNIGLSKISTIPDPNGGPTIPIETIVNVEGAIEVNHTWSN